MKYFLDTYALVEITKGNRNFDKFMDKDCITLHNNVAELYYSELLKMDTENAMSILRSVSRMVVNIHPETIENAMKFRYNNKKKKFSYIDCFGYVFALENKRIFVTGDKAFEDMENVEFVK